MKRKKKMQPITDVVRDFPIFDIKRKSERSVSTTKHVPNELASRIAKSIFNDARKDNRSTRKAYQMLAKEFSL